MRLSMSIKILSISALLPLFLTFTPKVFAFEENFYSTITFTIGSVGEEGLQYDESKLEGDNTFETITFNTIDNFLGGIYPSRAANISDKVAVPPYSTVDVGYFWFNNTQQEYVIDEIRLPISKENSHKGDLSSIIFDIGFQEGETCTPDICKYGKYLDVEGIGIVSAGMGIYPGNGVVIASYTVKPPVEITKYEVEYYDEYLSKVTLYIQNNTSEFLRDVRLNYKTIVDKILDFSPYEEIVLQLFKRCTLEENSINCGSMTIYDNNTNTECVVDGYPYINHIDRDTISQFNKIEGEWFTGLRTEERGDSFCITRIPYIYTTEDMIVYIEPEEPEEPDITPIEYWRELLNIDILPITGFQVDKFQRYIRLLKPLGIDNLNIL
jgi:hypothetical protein